MSGLANPSYRVLLCIALAVATAARLGFIFFEAENWWATDTYLYVTQAKQLLGGNWPSGAPNGYPLLIAGLLFLFGDSWDLAGVILNCILSTATVGMVFMLAFDRSASTWAAFLAAMIAALWPSQLIWVRVLYTEVPATFFLCAGLFLHLRNLDWLGGVFLVGAMLIRPTLVPIVLLISLVLMFKVEHWRAIKLASIPLIGIACAQIASSTDLNQSKGSFLAKNIMLSNFGVTKQSRTEFKYSGESVGEAINQYFKFLWESPKRFVEFRLSHLGNLWGPWPDRTKGRKDGHPRSVIRNLILGLQFPLFALGMVALLRKPNYQGFVLACPALVITVIHTGLFGFPRYNYPAIPFLIVLATCGTAAFVLNRISRSRN